MTKRTRRKRPSVSPTSRRGAVLHLPLGSLGQDWERVTSCYRVHSFSAKPAVNLRPTVNGLGVVVRYITRAPQRYAVRSKLFQAIVDLLHKPLADNAAAVLEAHIAP